MSNLETARTNMIKQQLRPWEVLDENVLNACSVVKREDYVPEALKGLAYADYQLPVVKGEYMLKPNLEGRLLQALQIKPSDSVLEIGSASGYVTACLAYLADRVLSLDLHAEATAIASANLAAQGVQNVTLETIESLDSIDYPERFDVIAVCAGSLDSVPDNLKTALAIGGRLFVVTGQSPAKEAMLITRNGSDEWTSVHVLETDIPAIV